MSNIVRSDILDANFISNNPSSSQQQQTPIASYGGTKFCLVAIPSPIMQRSKQCLENDLKEEISSNLRFQTKIDQVLSGKQNLNADNRVSNPAFVDNDVDCVDSGKDSNGYESSRIGRMLQTLRKDLISLQHKDQDLLRQFLTIYQTISELHYGDLPLAPPTPSPEPQVFQFQGSAALSPAIMADEVRDLVSYQGQLNIRDVVSRLSPIRRRRTSLPLLDDDISQSLENSTEDLMSLSSPFL